MREVITRIPCEFMFQLIIAELIFLSFCKKRKGFYWKVIVFSFIMIIGYDLITNLIPLPESQFMISFSISLCYIATLLGYWWCYDVKFNEILFCGVSAYAVQNFGHNIYIWLKTYIGFEDGSSISAMITVLLFTSIYTSGYLLFAGGVAKYKIEDVSRLRNLANSIFILLLTTFLPILFSNSGEDGNVLFLLYALMGDILVIFIEFNLLYEGKLLRQNEMMEHILLVGQRQYQISKDTIELINMKSHDLKHQIKALRNMKNEDMKEDVFKEIEQAILLYDYSIKTGNDTLDVILMEKSLYSEKNRIKLTCMADGTRLDFMKAYDIYSIFGNILDNAIESVCKEEDEEKRIISLNVGGRGKILKIHIENYFNGELIFENGLPKTTKEDANFHGYGMMSVRHIIEKYDGNMVATWENNLFVVNILIPIP